MPLIVHHLRVSQSERIVWLCEELGIPYTLHCYDRAPLEAPKEIKELPGNRLGSAPVIQDGDDEKKPTVTLGESAAIVQYILARYGGDSQLIVDPQDANYPEYVFWLHMANGTLQPTALLNMSFDHAGVAEDNFIRGVFERRLARVLTFMDERLALTGAYLAGERFTVADIMPVFTITTFRHFYRFSLAKYPNILEFLKRIGERPAYREAMRKGDPELVLLLGAEPPAKTVFELVQ